MSDAAEEFRQRVAVVLARFFAQNDRPVLADAEVAGFAARLWGLVLERGLPRPLARHATGVPGEMSAEECAPLVAQVLAPGGDPLLADAARQLVKACFNPEFKTCRNSFCEVDAVGSCRRQELARARKRTSGSHCVDCPYWLSLNPTQHERFLSKRWRTGGPEFLAHRGIFLPEDFRALRRWLHARAREVHRRPALTRRGEFKS